MNLKKLTQAVFEGLPSEYRWAVVRNCGSANAFNSEPKFFKADFRDWDFNNVDTVFLGMDYDATNWQNSMIEHQDAPTAVQSSFESQLNQKRNFAELHDKPFTLCRPDVPTAADIDWSTAPEGATHWHDGEWIRWTGHKDMNLWNLDAWDGCQWTLSAYGFHGTLEGFLADGAIKRPESIHDVARSIEAARVEEQKFKVKPCPHGCVAATIEQSERTYPHYFKDVSDVDAIDLYHVARLYDITDPALFHAFKKIACAGKRGAKDQAQDVQEAIDALKRWKELNV